MFRYSKATFAREVVMLALAVVFVFPVYILVNMALRPSGDTSSPLLPPTQPTFGNFIEAWNQAGLASALLNSAIVTVTSVVLIVAISAMAAYPLARVLSKLSTALFWVVLVGMMIPFQVALIPLYQTMRDLGLLGSLFSLILFYTGSQVPFSVFLYTGFLRTLDRDYEEAAAIDGAGPVRTFVSIVFPLLRPITGTVIILNAITIWNDFLVPLLYLSGTPQQTVPVALFAFVGQFVSNWPVVFAGLIISVLPVLTVYFLMQKQIIKGFAGGLKG
ncbi:MULTISPECIES: carbohydrate ABC transporter permease [unclassified Pseudoclavibacter]|uniref:carbohydrate ABC transporter permease n=1 Tax=unclassified Pseudoclavibacter TaxID=2615177 RepID=UPI000CE8CB0B|nr:MULTISPECIES: carbohydrate ABC transporter permease [unclassified Pseudoclavibacter]MBS3179892.1 carbohydrate ABC transporter permease [Pseudoclavibacter sp. Marseille-Q4354]NYF14286.1 raffinose/stachyose/melibiose transport system permease protein [Pseudoclavibacter sp. JAI123]PPG31244.1 sugar ABC transporter permease [Pseudoclavibacter sp. RFBB5]PPG43850.1 sugar ABC transporter permease [Pseudoclavibacter sp. RFBA6]